MSILKEKTKNYRIILGSGSPRRKELLAGLDIEFTVEANGNIDESFDAACDPAEIPALLSLRKSQGFHRELQSNEILITADTLVICDGEILGKPTDREDAVTMLQKLSAKSHTVITAVTIRGLGKCETFSSKTTVFFNQLYKEQIDYYIDNYSPYDKAGSYAVQEWIGYSAISRIEGSYFNVMGLPVHQLSHKLLKFI
ncbi:MAG: Maf family nucleotide pyrophosphatase [Bacteroidales bacterium]|nr:Maf family nucleotide pyrophosphatase [Bacteroidales bacterium]MDD4656888.1 Maf family nucleotide pyrophosphatase [Bacteroidales bacterium]